jgi:hypothetical protein
MERDWQMNDFFMPGCCPNGRFFATMRLTLSALPFASYMMFLYGTFMATLCAPHFALCALLFSLCPLRSALCPLPFALCSLRFALCSLRSALCPLLFALFALPFALCSLRSMPHVSMVPEFFWILPGSRIIFPVPIFFHPKKFRKASWQLRAGRRLFQG